METALSGTTGVCGLHRCSTLARVGGYNPRRNTWKPKGSVRTTETALEDEARWAPAAESERGQAMGKPLEGHGPPSAQMLGKECPGSRQPRRVCCRDSSHAGKSGQDGTRLHQGDSAHGSAGPGSEAPDPTDNRVCNSYDDILDHCCFAWNKLIGMPWKIIYIGTREGTYRRSCTRRKKAAPISTCGVWRN